MPGNPFRETRNTVCHSMVQKQLNMLHHAVSVTKKRILHVHVQMYRYPYIVV